MKKILFMVLVFLTGYVNAAYVYIGTEDHYCGNTNSNSVYTLELANQRNLVSGIEDWVIEIEYGEFVSLHRIETPVYGIDIINDERIKIVKNGIKTTITYTPNQEISNSPSLIEASILHITIKWQDNRYTSTDSYYGKLSADCDYWARPFGNHVSKDNQKSYLINPPSTPSYVNSTFVRLGGVTTLSTSSVSTATNYKWIVEGSTLGGSGESINYHPNKEGTHSYSVQASNACGISSKKNGSFNVYPEVDDSGSISEITLSAPNEASPGTSCTCVVSMNGPLPQAPFRYSWYYSYTGSNYKPLNYTGSSATLTMPGGAHLNFKVVVTDAAGYEFTRTKRVWNTALGGDVTKKEKDDSGSDFIELDASFDVYPNPTTGNVTIDNMDEEYSYVIINMNGSIVKKESAKMGANTIDLTDQPSGIYFVNLKTLSGQVINKKVIKK